MTKTSENKQVGLSLLGLLAMRRARAEHQRKLDAAAKKPPTGADDAPSPPKKRKGWFG